MEVSCFCAVYQIFLALASRYSSASPFQRSLCLPQISASLANRGSLSPAFAKSSMAVRGRSMLV